MTDALQIPSFGSLLPLQRQESAIVACAAAAQCAAAASEAQATIGAGNTRPMWQPEDSPVGVGEYGFHFSGFCPQAPQSGGAIPLRNGVF